MTRSRSPFMHQPNSTTNREAKLAVRAGSSHGVTRLLGSASEPSHSVTRSRSPFIHRPNSTIRPRGQARCASAFESRSNSPTWQRIGAESLRDSIAISFHAPIEFNNQAERPARCASAFESRSDSPTWQRIGAESLRDSIAISFHAPIEFNNQAERPARCASAFESRSDSPTWDVSSAYTHPSQVQPTDRCPRCNVESVQNVPRSAPDDRSSLAARTRRSGSTHC